MYFLNESLASNSLTTLICSAAIYISRKSPALLCTIDARISSLQSYTTLPRLTNNRSFFLSRNVEATDVAGAATLNKTSNGASEPGPKTAQRAVGWYVAKSPGALGLSNSV